MKVHHSKDSRGMKRITIELNGETLWDSELNDFAKANGFRRLKIERQIGRIILKESTADNATNLWFRFSKRNSR